ncbi:MAG: hypothetical protein ACREPD_04850 [Stenotrophomonas sp.]|uniref:hypothetical protein n=1 Tax=Stenotrophomonas sp. TaxID=69392 RepID=UPI003D6D28C0
MANNSVPPTLDLGAVAAAVDDALDAPSLSHPSGREYYDQAWEKNPLNMAITNRLFRIERSIKGIKAIHSVLHEDKTRSDLARDCYDEYTYEGLSPSVTENLNLAIFELLNVSEGCLEEIRMDEYQMATLQSKGEA